MVVLPRRHTGPPNAILDDVEQFPVAQALYHRVRKVRRFGVHVPAQNRFSASITTVACRAMITVMIRCGSPYGCIRPEWIVLLFDIGRNGEANQSRCDRTFDVSRVNVGG